MHSQPVRPADVNLPPTEHIDITWVLAVEGASH